jgi:ssDNA-binding Zn-finger/Zn-ribbon topoisomerase 1
MQLKEVRGKYMAWVLYSLIGVLVVLLFVIKRLIAKDTPQNEKVTLPYKKRDDFLSEAELYFYRTLGMYLGDKTVVCPKVGAKELVFISNCVGKDYMKFFNYIAKKHIDFVLCDAKTMQVICAVELDDKSHQKEGRKHRDAFIDRVFATAQIPLFHIKAQSSYTRNDFTDILNCVHSAESKSFVKSAQTAIKIKKETPDADDLVPICPKCGVRMVKRKATRGTNYGKEFYGCVNFPKCREVKEI